MIKNSLVKLTLIVFILAITPTPAPDVSDENKTSTIKKSKIISDESCKESDSCDDIDECYDKEHCEY